MDVLWGRMMGNVIEIEDDSSSEEEILDVTEEPRQGEDERKKKACRHSSSNGWTTSSDCAPNAAAIDITSNDPPDRERKLKAKKRKYNAANEIVDQNKEIIDLTTSGAGNNNFETDTSLSSESDYRKAKRTLRMATSTETEDDTNARNNSGNTSSNRSDGIVWENLSRILNDPRCKDEPSGPSEQENRLLSKITEFGITPYKFEVPLGNGVSDCVGHDRNNRLCVVEAKCIFGKTAAKRRAKVIEQTAAYATYLSQATRSDVAAYSFDNQDGLIALESFGIFKFEKIKNHNPRGGKSGAYTGGGRPKKKPKITNKRHIHQRAATAPSSTKRSRKSKRKNDSK